MGGSISNSKGAPVHANSSGFFTDTSFPPGASSLGQIVPMPFTSAADHGQNVAEDVTQWIRAMDLRSNSRSAGGRGGEDGVLFDDIEVRDIIQGDNSDCYLMATLAALAEYPDNIRRLIAESTVSPAGKYHVRLFSQETYSWEEIEIDDWIPCNKEGRPVFSSPRQGELWVLLIEKALAKYCGGYGALWGGYGSFILPILCGVKETQVFMKQNVGVMLAVSQYGNGDPAWLSTEEGQRIKTDTLDGGGEDWVQTTASVVQTDARNPRGVDYHVTSSAALSGGAGGSSEALWTRLRKADLDHDMVLVSVINRSIAGAGLMPNGLAANHYYSVIQVWEEDKEEKERGTGAAGNAQNGDSAPKGRNPLQLIQLRNPWGNKYEWRGDWSDNSGLWFAPKYKGVAEAVKFEGAEKNGLFWMSFEDFVREFSGIEIAKIGTGFQL